MSLFQSTSLPSPISTFSRLLNFFLQRCWRINYVYKNISIWIKSVNTLRCQTYPILLSSRQPNVFAHLPATWVAQHAQNLPWNSDRAKDIDIPLLPSNHDLYIGILYIHFSECILMLILCQKKNSCRYEETWKPLSTLPRSHSYLQVWRPVDWR